MAEAIHVLIVDDSEDDRELCRRALLKAQDALYEVDEADNGDTAIDKIAHAPPDCVLLDYSLPGRNGVEVLKLIRANHPFVPVLMLTGQGSETIAVSAMQQGAQNYIAKSAIATDRINHAIQVAMAHCEMQRRLHEQRLSLEIFTRALAHDLKEPVRTIRSFISVIGESETLSQTGKSYFGFVETAAARMSALIDAVYDFTRLDASAQPIAHEEADLAEILSGAAADLNGLISDHRAQISIGDMPVITGNHARLRQVLQNLISNAIHHGPEAARIDVKGQEDATHWIISVADNGPGIEDAQRARIFEPFSRLSGTGGLGMGLAICKRIVEAHHGRIWCEKGDLGGAKFVFTIPKGAPDTTRSGPAPSACSNNATSEDDDIATILVVDDNEAAIELARIMLVEQSKLRCKIKSARSGQEAIEMLRHKGTGGRSIDLVLLDINMPLMDGFDVLRELRQLSDSTPPPVIMCSTSSYDKDKERAKALGAQGYLEKPPQLRHLQPLLGALPGLRMELRDNVLVLVRAA